MVKNEQYLFLRDKAEKSNETFTSSIYLKRKGSWEENVR